MDLWRSISWVFRQVGSSSYQSFYFWSSRGIYRNVEFIGFRLSLGDSFIYCKMVGFGKAFGSGMRIWLSVADLIFLLPLFLFLLNFHLLLSPLFLSLLNFHLLLLPFCLSLSLFIPFLFIFIWSSLIFEKLVSRLKEITFAWMRRLIHSGDRHFFAWKTRRDRFFFLNLLLWRRCG